MRKRFSLNDFTFILLVRIDSIQRIENTLTVVKYLNKYFTTHINVLECDRRENGILKQLLGKKISYSFKEDYDPILYRTKWLNYMLDSVNTEFVAVWDVDIIVPVSQILQSVTELRSGRCDFMYPYKKNFLDTSEVIKEQFFQSLNTKVLERNMKYMKCLYLPDPAGGAFFCKMSSYRESGFENESFYGWGLEDGERYTRWKRMGYVVTKVNAPIYHLTHPRGINSSDHSNYQEQNILKIRELIKAYYITSEKKGIEYENGYNPENF